MDKTTDILFWGLILALLIGLLFWLNKQCLAANKSDWGKRWLNRIDGLNRLFCVKYHRLNYEPFAIPESGGAIIISNHVSGLDPLLLVAAARRPLRFMIASEEYNRFGFKWLFKSIGCIPINRGGRSEGALREAIKALNSGEIIAMFPYGGIHVDEKALPAFKGGAIMLAKKTNSTLYPVRVEGIAGMGHTILAVPMRSRAHLKQYDPVRCDDLEHKACIKVLDELFRNGGNTLS